MLGSKVDKGQLHAVCEKDEFYYDDPEFLLCAERPPLQSLMNGAGSSLSPGFSLFTHQTEEHIWNTGFEWQAQGADLSCKSNRGSVERSRQVGENLNSPHPFPDSAKCFFSFIKKTMIILPKLILTTPKNTLHSLLVECIFSTLYYIFILCILITYLFKF